MKRARELSLSLLDNVREQYNRFKENPPQRAGFGYGQHNQQPPTPSNPYGGYGQQSSGYGGAQSPTTPAAPPGTAGAPGASSPGNAATDYATQYAQYYGGQDPYAAYGGYQNYVAYYQYYQQQQAAQQGQDTPSAPSGLGEEAPPPPPPSGSPPASGGYNSVSVAHRVRKDEGGEDVLEVSACVLKCRLLGTTTARNVICLKQSSSVLRGKTNEVQRHLREASSSNGRYPRVQSGEFMVEYLFTIDHSHFSSESRGETISVDDRHRWGIQYTLRVVKNNRKGDLISPGSCTVM